MRNWSTVVTLSTCALILMVVSTRSPSVPVIRTYPSSSESADPVATFQRGDSPGAFVAQDDPLVASLAPGRFQIGISCCLATNLLRSQLQLTPGTGLVVLGVAPGGPAARAGIQIHDVLVSMDVAGTTTPLATPEEFFSTIESVGSQAITLHYIRLAQEDSTTVTPEPRPPELVLVSSSAESPAPNVAWTMPEIILPRGVLLEFSRSSRGATRIRVRRGDETWDATAADVSMLPSDLQQVVRQLSLPAIADEVVLADSPNALPLPPTPIGDSDGVTMADANRSPSPVDVLIRKYRRDILKHQQELRQLQAQQQQAAQRVAQSQDVIQRRLEDLKGTLEQLLEQPDSVNK